MKFGVLLILPLLLAPVLAQAYVQSLPTESFLTDFFNEYSNELTSMAMAAIAAVGIQFALKKSKYFGEARELNFVTLAIFISFFLLITYTQTYTYFIPFLGYLFIIGLGLLLLALYKGMESANIKNISKIAAGLGCFFIAWFSFNMGLAFVGIFCVILGIILILYGIPSILDKFGSKGNLTTSNEEEEEFENEVESIQDDDEYNKKLEESKELVEKLLIDLKNAEKNLKEFAGTLGGGNGQQ